MILYLKYMANNMCSIMYRMELWNKISNLKKKITIIYNIGKMCEQVIVFPYMCILYQNQVLTQIILKQSALFGNNNCKPLFSFCH